MYISTIFMGQTVSCIVANTLLMRILMIVREQYVLHHWNSLNQSINTFINDNFDDSRMYSILASTIVTAK